MNKVSLLYKNSGKRLAIKGEMREFLRDLQFGGIFEVMCEDCRGQSSKNVIASVLAELCGDPDEINYRYDVLQDFLRVPELLEGIEKLFSGLGPVERDRQASIRIKNKVSAEYKLARHIGLFLEYCGIYKKLAALLNCQKKFFISEGLINLSGVVCGYSGSDSFKELEEILRRLKQSMKGYMRLKLEAHLDTSFKLTKAAAIDIDSNGFGADCSDKPEYTGASLVQGLIRLLNPGSRLDQAYIIKNNDYILEQNVNEIKDKVLGSISSVLEVMTTSISSFFTKLSEEITFYKGAARLVKVIKKLGLPATKPVMVSGDERVFTAEGLYDLSFALYLAKNSSIQPSKVIVPNEACFDDSGRIQVVTGPNQGGKTTYLRAIGILQVLAQAGIPVPAAKAVLSPADAIYTHFPADERPESNEGRLGEELFRLRSIVEKATSKSLVLMNESLASTNSREGSVIAADVLSAFSIMGVRCAFVTHLYELAENVEEINEKLQHQRKCCSRLVSMAAQFVEIPACEGSKAIEPARSRTYRILPGQPARSSFAADIAEQFGIRFNSFSSGQI